MKNKINIIKLQIMPRQAKASPNIASALGQKGVNIMKFCKQFNEKTANIDSRLKLKTVISVKEDKSFTIKINAPTTTLLIKEYQKQNTGYRSENRIEYYLTEQDINDIAQIKQKDTSAYDMESCKKIIKGTAKSMRVGIKCQ